MSEPEEWRRHIQDARFSLLEAEVCAGRLDQSSFSSHLMAASQSLTKAHFSFEPAEEVGDEQE